MYSITDIKKGTVINLDGTPHRVVEYNHSSMGRGGAVARTKLRNLVDGSVTSKTFRGSDKIEPADIKPVEAQFLYSDGEQAYFMRLDTFEQVGLNQRLLASELPFIPEGTEVKLLYHGQTPLTCELPLKVELAVVEADPGVKGDSASNVMKQCRVETGATIQVPLFIEAGDHIRVDTRSGEYVERV